LKVAQGSYTIIRFYFKKIVSFGFMMPLHIHCTIFFRNRFTWVSELMCTLEQSSTHTIIYEMYQCLPAAGSDLRDRTCERHCHGLGRVNGDRTADGPQVTGQAENLGASGIQKTSKRISPR